MIWLKVPSSGTLIRGCSPLTCPDSKVRNGGGGVEARSCQDWDPRLSFVSKLPQGMSWYWVGGFSLTILLLSTFEKARCCFFQHQERRNLIQSLTLGQQIGGGRWSGGPMSAVSTPVQAATPPCHSPAKPFPLLLSSPHPTPPLSITSTGTPSPHERLCSRQVWRSNTVLAVPILSR